MIRLYGSPMSSSGRTRWMLEEVGQPYDYVVVNAREGGTRAPEFLAKNPTGKIPFLEDGELRLAESIAINFYLAERYAPALMPDTLEGRALCWQWSLWAITNVQPESMSMLLHTAMLPPDKRHPETAKQASTRLARYAQTLETLLEHDHLLGSSFGVADLNVASVFNVAMRSGVAVGERTEAWMERLRSRPAYQRAAQS